MREFCLNIEPFRQPQPVRNPGGDCFACAMTAALRHLFPERPVEFLTAWNYFLPDGRETPSNVWPGVRAALWKAYSDGYRMEIAADLVKPDWDVETFSHSWWMHFPTGNYTRRLEGYLRSGFVAFAQIDFSGGGPLTPEGKLRVPDHFILIDGVREGREPLPNGGAVQMHYLHVVCSVRGAYWIKQDDLLIKHGAAGWWLVRRTDE